VRGVRAVFTADFLTPGPLSRALRERGCRARATRGWGVSTGCGVMACRCPRLSARTGDARVAPTRRYVDGVPSRAMQGEGAVTGPARHRWHTRACRHGGV